MTSEQIKILRERADQFRRLMLQIDDARAKAALAELVQELDYRAALIEAEDIEGQRSGA